MLTVENDWIQYETVPARRVAVRGGASCAQRVPVVQVRAATAVRPAAPAIRPVRAAVAPATRRNGPMRLTRRGRLVLLVVPAVLALSGALLAAGAGTAQAADQRVPVPAQSAEAGR